MGNHLLGEIRDEMPEKSDENDYERGIIVVCPLSVVSEWYQKAPDQRPRAFFSPEDSAYLSRIRRADERTRTADLLQLRVIHQALQGFADGCKFRIPRPISCLRFALCCTVLRTRWYQSGIRRP